MSYSPLVLADPEKTVTRITAFISDTFRKATKTKAVIAVSGGIDSAVSLTLAARALSPENVVTLFLPYANQDMSDAHVAAEFAQIPEKNQLTIDIAPIVSTAASLVDVGIAEADALRLGNFKARARMLMLFDLAKYLDALVVGTENKSEKYLGYFTRFGDEASDLEPLQHLYKTQIRQLADYLKIPEPLRSKQPSAGLWQGQTDEAELGFTYEVADQVLAEIVDAGRQPNQVVIPGMDPAIVMKVADRVEKMHFKHEVPYVITSL